MNAEEIPTPELCDRYAALYTGAVTDVLDDAGYQDQTLSPEISPITDDRRMAGIAYPCRGRPNRSVDTETNIRNILRMLGEAPPHSIVMYESNADVSAQIGELSVECLQAGDCRGAVVDGGARDLGFILDTEFPLFTRYRTPADAVPRWELLSWDEPAVVGGVEVRPEDVVVGDVDGVAVVPRQVSGEVLREAEALVDTEGQVREAVRSGTDPLDAYDEYGVF